MHVLILPSWYPDAADAQRGSFFRDQARLLRDAGQIVGVLTVPRPRFLRDLPMSLRAGAVRNRVGCEDDDGIPTYRTARWLWLPGRLGPTVIRRQIARASDRLWRRYVADRGRPDVIHAQGTLHGGHLAVRLGRRHRVPVVLIEHSSAFLRVLVRPDETPVVAAALRGAASVSAVGPGLAAALRAYAPEIDVTIVPNPVDVAYFAPGPTSAPGSPFAFVAVAHLRPVKGVDLMLRAFAMAFGPTAANGRDARLRIAGDGPERARLEALAVELGVTDRVAFLGALTREPLRALYRQSHALVSASEVETFGLAVAEALACGLRVVATRSGGPDALVEATGGWLTPAGDVRALAGALVEAAGSAAPDPRRGRAAVVACCAPEAWLERMTALYAAAIGPTKPAVPPLDPHRGEPVR